MQGERKRNQLGKGRGKGNGYRRGTRFIEGRGTLFVGWRCGFGWSVFVKRIISRLKEYQDQSFSAVSYSDFYSDFLSDESSLSAFLRKVFFQIRRYRRS